MKTLHRQSGLSLIEMLVAMTIGVVLIFGATKVYVGSNKAYGVSESVARLQETARYAMAVIEPDIRMSNYWGLLKGAAVISNQVAQTQPPGAIAPGAPVNVCGNNFAIDVSTNLQGDNNGGVATGVWLSNTRQAGCNTLTDINTGVAWNAVPVTTADTLTVRRASTVPLPGPAVAGVLQICTSRIAGRMISDGSACNGIAAGVNQLSNLIVNAYYVDRNSVQLAARPSLRRKVLTSAGGVLQFRDQEIISGVEDMQVQFGIDPLGNTGIATRYVNPDGVPAGAQIVAVRIWLLVYSDTPENGFTDTRVYQYGDRLAATGVTGDLNAAAGAGMAYQPSLNPDASFNGPQHRRRLLITRTIQVRNALGT